MCSKSYVVLNGCTFQVIFHQPESCTYPNNSYRKACLTKWLQLRFLRHLIPLKLTLADLNNSTKTVNRRQLCTINTYVNIIRWRHWWRNDNVRANCHWTTAFTPLTSALLSQPRRAPPWQVGAFDGSGFKDIKISCPEWDNMGWSYFWQIMRK